MTEYSSSYGFKKTVNFRSLFTARPLPCFWGRNLSKHGNCVHICPFSHFVEK